MAIDITATDVRNAGDLDTEDNPDSSLQFEISQAEAIVNDDLAPHTDKTSRLELVGALLAAAYVADEDGATSSITEGQASESFDTETALTLFRQAKQLDPTGRLGQLEKPTARIDVPDARGVE